MRVSWSEAFDKVRIQREGLCQCRCHCNHPGIILVKDITGNNRICQQCYDERMEFLPPIPPRDLPLLDT